jgi:hypothetical protein
MVRIDGDYIPASSGSSHLGVDGNVNNNGNNAFDASTISPFGHVIQNSGVFLDPHLGQSGILRFSLAAAALQVSVDGGATFENLSAGGVDSIGVLGDANLTGNVDLATPSSGFLAIEDSSNNSPLLFSVDTLGLSGLWDFPSQGFNGSIVNEVVVGGTSVQGSITFAGASGITADLVGQTLTFTAGPSIAKCYGEAFTSQNNFTVTHGLVLTRNPVVMIYDVNNNWIVPDSISVLNANQIQIRFNTTQTGSVTVIGC